MPGGDVIYQYTPLRGVQVDFDNLLKAFEETGNVRYETFNRLWKERHFFLLYSGRQNERECREFVEECLRLLLESWLPTNGFHTKVGLLYIMYSVYFTQPINPKSKIRVTLPVWSMLGQFIQDVKEQKHMDVEFIFHTLRFHHAFHFVSSTSWPSTSLRGGCTGQAFALIHDDEHKEIEPSVITHILEPDHIDQLSAIHEHYHRMKCLIASSGNPQPSLNIIQTNLVQVLTKTVASHEEWRKTQGGRKGGRKRRDSGQTTTSESDVDSDSDYTLSPGRKSPSKSQGTIRAEIRAKAFAATHTPTRGVKRPQSPAKPPVPQPPPTQSSAGKGRKKRKTSRQESSEESQTEDDSLFSASPMKKEEDRVMMSMPTLDEEDVEEEGPMIWKVNTLGDCSSSAVPQAPNVDTPRGRGRRQKTTPRNRTPRTAPLDEDSLNTTNDETPKAKNVTMAKSTPVRGRGRGRGRGSVLLDTPPVLTPRGRGRQRGRRGAKT